MKVTKEVYKRKENAIKKNTPSTPLIPWKT
jgi:hypothetical protein